MSDFPDVDYLSVSLSLTESGHGETAKFNVLPLFDQPRMELHVENGHDVDDGTFVILNRRQIECLSDFLRSWLERA
jgi:hypothetical protein